MGIYILYISKDNICIFMHHYRNHHILLGAKLRDIVRYDYDLMTSQWTQWFPSRDQPFCPVTVG